MLLHLMGPIVRASHPSVSIYGVTVVITVMRTLVLPLFLGFIASLWLNCAWIVAEIYRIGIFQLGYCVLGTGTVGALTVSYGKTATVFIMGSQWLSLLWCSVDVYVMGTL